MPGVGPACDRNVFAGSLDDLRGFVDLSRRWKRSDVYPTKPEQPEWYPKPLDVVLPEITGIPWEQYTDTETGVVIDDLSVVDLMTMDEREFLSARKRMLE